MDGALSVKIVYFIDHLRPDGTQRVLTQLVQGLGERGHSQAVVCLNDSWDADIVDNMQANGCQVRVVGKAALATGVGLVNLFRWLRRERFERAVTLLFYADVLGRPLARMAGVPRVVTSLRARNVNYSSWQRWLARYSMRWVDWVVINSAGIRDYAVHLEGVNPQRIILIPNGISVTAEDQNDDQRAIYRHRLLSELSLNPESVLIGTAGRLSYQKGFDVLIQAVALAHIPDFHLLIMGAGELERTLRNQAANQGLDGRVHFMGYRHDLPDLLRVLDVYVQPSRFEGMPNALMEAIGAGCPVIVSAVDGNFDLVVDGVSGWVVPTEDPQALKNALVVAVNRREDARLYAQRAIARLAANYPLSKMIISWEQALSGDISVN
jgi:glycosyltransferase involved in cell wall biosynthesis